MSREQHARVTFNFGHALVPCIRFVYGWWPWPWPRAPPSHWSPAGTFKGHATAMKIAPPTTRIFAINKPRSTYLSTHRRHHTLPTLFLPPSPTPESSATRTVHRALRRALYHSSQLTLPPTLSALPVRAKRVNGGALFMAVSPPKEDTSSLSATPNIVKEIENLAAAPNAPKKLRKRDRLRIPFRRYPLPR